MASTTFRGCLKKLCSVPRGGWCRRGVGGGGGLVGFDLAVVVSVGVAVIAVVDDAFGVGVGVVADAVAVIVAV